MLSIETVTVVRGTPRDPTIRVGPLPGRQQGMVPAYEWEVPARFAPWPGRTCLERSFMLASAA